MYLQNAPRIGSPTEKSRGPFLARDVFLSTAQAAMTIADTRSRAWLLLEVSLQFCDVADVFHLVQEECRFSDRVAALAARHAQAEGIHPTVPRKARVNWPCNV